ncbi:MAG: AAA family ATPase [Blautia sp.]
MSRRVSIGYQEFEDIIRNDLFYIDKTAFIKEWWERRDRVTLITRPRRFGKTLTMSMVENFFSVTHVKSAELFQHLSIWKDVSYRKLQGSYPVISLTFANVKECTFQATKQRMNQILTDLYNKHIFLLDGALLTEEEKKFFRSVTMDMDDTVATLAIHKMSDFLSRYYGKKVIILLDEYDTPMQEAYINGYWDELSSFLRSMLNAAFKTNPYLERAIMTGITRISKESIFSDLNNLKVVTTTSNEYAEYFGFTEAEVCASLEEYHLSDRLEDIRSWYDGFTFGDMQDIYNPWSILNYLSTQKFSLYWANTSSNSLVNKLIQEGSKDIKQKFESLLNGQPINVLIDEQIVYNQLSVKESSIWSLLLASGYLKVAETRLNERSGRIHYQLELTNKEVRIMFETMIHDWFSDYDSGYNDFIKALLQDDIKAMNVYMNRVALVTFSFFDSGTKASAESEPERFYHGFVLGLLVDLGERYSVTSNRESGFGRYDVILEPKNKKDDAVILEFKVQDTNDEKTLSDTVKAALYQINCKQYDTVLLEKGIPENKIRKYGFAFHGKQVLIGK